MASQICRLSRGTEITQAGPVFSRGRSRCMAGVDGQWRGREPNMMIAMPSRLTLTPTQSVTVGWMRSTTHNHAMATEI